MVRFQPTTSGRLLAFVCCAPFMFCMAPVNGQSNTKDLLKTLSSGTAAEKLVAVDKLGQSGQADQTVVAALVKGLKDSDVKLRWHSARALGWLGPKAASGASALRVGLKDSQSSVRIESAHALGLIGDRSDETVNALVGLVLAEDREAARSAVGALRSMDLDKKAVLEVFAKCLNENEHATVAHAVEALVERGKDAVPFLLAALKGEKSAYWACMAIEEIGADAAETVPELVSLMKTAKDSQTRIHALLAIGAIGPAAQSAEAEVSGRFSNLENGPERNATVYALGAIGAKKADAVFKQALKSDDQFLSMVASWALAKTHPNDERAVEYAVKQLTQALNSEDANMRTVAAKGLLDLDLPSEKVAPYMIKLVNDPDPSVVANVIDALASLGAPAAERAAKALTKKELRAAALSVLARLGSDAKSVVPLMCEAINETDSEFSASIQYVLAKLGPDAAAATAVLEKSLGSSKDEMRHSAIYALGRIGPAAKGAKNSLSRLAEKGSGFDSIGAWWALVQVFPKDEKIARESVEPLIEGLQKNQDVLVRLECAMALGSLCIESKSATDALQRAAKEDSSELVRDASAELIGQ